MMDRTVSNIREQLAATHLDYPHSRAVHDVELLLAEIDRLASLNNALTKLSKNVLENLETVPRDTDWGMTKWKVEIAVGRIAAVLSAIGTLPPKT